MLLTGSSPAEGRVPTFRSSMGFLKVSHQHHHHHHHTNQHHKTPSPLSESLSERFSTIIDNCQKKIKLLQGPSALFNSFVTKARRKDRECSSTHEHKLYLEEAVLERNIPETDLRQLVDHPPGLGYEEWLASHTIDFFHHINLLYGTVCEFCTLTGCPDMTGPGLRQYLWFDEKGKKTRVAAPQYVDYVMTFTQNTVNDESIFPTKFENEFPSSFESIVKKIHRLLFHVVAHLYHAHFREVVLLSLHAHLNCLFAHFVLFNEKFKLVDEKETEILHDLVLALKIHPESDGHLHTIDRQEEHPLSDIEGKSSEGDPSLCYPQTTLPENPSSGSPKEDMAFPLHLVSSDVNPLRGEEHLLYDRHEPSTSVTATVTQVSASIPSLGASYVNNVTLADVLP